MLPSVLIAGRSSKPRRAVFSLSSGEQRVRVFAHGLAEGEVVTLALLTRETRDARPADFTPLFEHGGPVALSAGHTALTIQGPGTFELRLESAAREVRVGVQG